MVYFLKVVGLHTTAYLMWNTTKVFYHKSGEGVIYSIKIHKTTHSDIKGKSAFQTIAIELYKQPKETNRNSFSRLVISSVRVDVVAKTDDEVCDSVL